MKSFKTSIVILLLCNTLLFAGEKFSYVDIIEMMTDLERLAELPEAGYKCQQASSYDRRSKYDPDIGQYIQWYANGDGSGYVRKEGDDLVLAQIKGPAVIWRIWSALPKEGHVKIYLEGQAEPAVDLPFIGYFNRKNKPFDKSAMVYMAAKGQNCYVPIPFNKSCRIVAEKDWGKFFHFTYTKFPDDTTLPTFSRNLTDQEAIALEKANNILANCGVDPAGKRKA